MDRILQNILDENDETIPDQSPIVDIRNYIESTNMVLRGSIDDALFDEDSDDLVLSRATTPIDSQNRDAQERVHRICQELKDTCGWKGTAEVSPGPWSSSDQNENSFNMLTSLPITQASTTTTLSSTINVSRASRQSHIDEKGQLQLLFPLEKIYRPRYKSDYFPQHGAPRRPRYIADHIGQHFITLIIPELYRNTSVSIFVRVALITLQMEDGQHYYSPYKFQQNHDDINIPDVNPIYLPVNTDDLDEDSRMKLQLVLIKSKSDHLKNDQPLRPFSDGIAQVQNLINAEPLLPKDLIAKYQLNKSHLAFTVCTLEAHHVYKPYPESTCISSIITETNTQKKVQDSGALEGEESPDSTVKRKVHCPKCNHSFEVERTTEPSTTVEHEQLTNDNNHQCCRQTTSTNHQQSMPKRKRNTTN